MLGWITTLVFYVFALILWRKIKTSENISRVKNLSTNARWLFGIFIFLNILDAWQTFFAIIWFPIFIEANPIFGKNVTLPMMIAAKSGMITLSYYILKRLSMRHSERVFNSLSIKSLIFVCIITAAVVISNEYKLYNFVYDIMQGGFFL